MALSARAEKRKNLFQANQEKLSEAERLDQRNDLVNFSERQLAISTTNRYRWTRQWFQEFLQICEPQHYDPKYFDTPGDVKYGSETFKAFAVYISQSRQGRISDKPCIRTILGMLDDTWRVIVLDRRSQFPNIEKENVRNFVKTDLKNQEGLTTAMHEKPLALRDDTNHLFSTLYSPECLSTFQNMRRVLNLTLWVNLMIDAGNRGGDMLHNSSKSSHLFPILLFQRSSFAFAFDGLFLINPCVP
jgi:hypothetical protein